MALYELPNGAVIGASPLGYSVVDLPAPSSGYNLSAALAGVPFTIDQPIAPTITSEVTCTTVAEVNASVAVNGRRTIIASGTYNFGGALTIGGNDKHIVCQSGAVLNVTEFQTSSAVRLQVDNAVINSTGQYGLRLSSSTDLAFTDLVLNAADSGFYPSACTRLRFLSSEITAAVHVSYMETGNSHFTVANSNFVSTQPFGGINGWCVRWGDGSADRMVFMDSRFRSEQNVVLRYEVAQTNGYFARNQIEGDSPFRTEGRDSGTPSAWPLDNLYVIDNDMYTIFGDVYVIMPGYPRMTNVTATGNRGYGPGAGVANLAFPTGQTTWTEGDNSHVTLALGNIPTWVMQ